jgi:hypothetical protein
LPLAAAEGVEGGEAGEHGGRGGHGGGCWVGGWWEGGQMAKQEGPELSSVPQGQTLHIS